MSKCNSSQIHLFSSLAVHWNAILPYSIPSSSLSVCSDSLLFPAFVFSPLLALLPQTRCSCPVVSSEMISSVVCCKESLKQQLCPRTLGCQSAPGHCTQHPIWDQLCIPKETSWWQLTGLMLVVGLRPVQMTPLFLILKAWRNGVSQKLPVDH